MSVWPCFYLKLTRFPVAFRNVQNVGLGPPGSDLCSFFLSCPCSFIPLLWSHFEILMGIILSHPRLELCHASCPKLCSDIVGRLLILFSSVSHLSSALLSAPTRAHFLWYREVVQPCPPSGVGGLSFRAEAEDCKPQNSDELVLSRDLTF